MYVLLVSSSGIFSFLTSVISSSKEDISFFHGLFPNWDLTLSILASDKNPLPCRGSLVSRLCPTRRALGHKPSVRQKPSWGRLFVVSPWSCEDLWHLCVYHLGCWQMLQQLSWDVYQLCSCPQSKRSNYWIWETFISQILTNVHSLSLQYIGKKLFEILRTSGQQSNRNKCVPGLISLEIDKNCSLWQPFFYDNEFYLAWMDAVSAGSLPPVSARWNNLIFLPPVSEISSGT